MFPSRRKNNVLGFPFSAVCDVFVECYNCHLCRNYVSKPEYADYSVLPQTESSIAFIENRERPMRIRLLRSFTTFVAVSLFFAAAQRASADTITLTFQHTTGATPITYSLNGSAGSAIPGPYSWTASPVPLGLSNPVSTFCIELTQTIGGGGQVYTINTDMSQSPTIGTTAKANAIEALYGNKSGYTDSAFQLALWELVYDGTYDIANPSANFFTTGSLKSSDTNVSNAQALLHTTLNDISGGINNFNSTYAGYELVALSSPNSQDQLLLMPTPPKSPAVPAPPAALLAGIGLLALGGRARWTRRTPNA
jgi:hypothetical protein